MTPFKVIIPARYQSSRFPGKPLADIRGKTMIQRVYQMASEAGAEQVLVATDDQRIARHVEDFGGQVCMTSAEHNSGTERLAEVAEKLALAADDIVVNVQGDEPFIPPENIRQVAENLAHYSLASMSTLSVPVTDREEVLDFNAVKVVTDKQGYALYFSRAVIPYHREHPQGVAQSINTPFQRHIGIYAYRAGFLSRYINWPMTELEQYESLEQLRVLWQGEKIHVAQAAKAPPPGIDTPQDLQRALRLLDAISG